MTSLRRVDTLIAIVLLAAGLPPVFWLGWTWIVLADAPAPDVRQVLSWFVWFLEGPGLLVPPLLCVAALGRWLSIRWLVRLTLVYQVISALVLGSLYLYLYAGEQANAVTFGHGFRFLLIVVALQTLSACVIPAALAVGAHRRRWAELLSRSSADGAALSGNWGHWPAALAMTRLVIVATGIRYAMSNAWLVQPVRMYDLASGPATAGTTEATLRVIGAVQTFVWPVLLVVCGLRMKMARSSLVFAIRLVCLGEAARWLLIVAIVVSYWFCLPWLGLLWSSIPLEGRVVAECLSQCSTTLVVGALLWYWLPLPLLRLRDTVLVPGEVPVCHRCGYNLTGNTSRRCPECGTAILIPGGDQSPTAPV
ncbi:MAG: hypothetical protein PVJ57_18715 [Phycisphaerae bacterium]|jgi:hypothetical protein